MSRRHFPEQHRDKAMSIAMFGSMFGLNLENKIRRRPGCSGAISPVAVCLAFGAAGMLEEAVEQQLHHKIIARAARETGLVVPARRPCHQKFRRHVRDLEFFGDFVKSTSSRRDQGIGRWCDGHRSAISARPSVE